MDMRMGLPEDVIEQVRHFLIIFSEAIEEEISSEAKRFGVGNSTKFNNISEDELAMKAQGCVYKAMIHDGVTRAEITLCTAWARAYEIRWLIDQGVIDEQKLRELLE